MLSDEFRTNILRDNDDDANESDDDEDTTGEKNETRLASLVGPWTVQSKIITSITHYQLEGHFIVYLVCDAQLRGNMCNLGTSCSEIENNVCLMDDSSTTGCYSMSDSIVDWSDMAVFFNLGTQIDAGSPFNVHTQESTGGWVGPYNVILAKNNSMIGEMTDEGEQIVDSYTMKYVTSPNTPYLKMPDDCNLLEYTDFYNYLGPGSVNNTAQEQIEYEFDENYDPYADYYDTCENGDVKPILPMIQFNFLKDDDRRRYNETVQVKVDYKILTFPTNPMFGDLVPAFKKHGAPISGPYCWGDNKDRAYSVDFYFDSQAEHPDDRIHFYHACIEGLPCIPPAVEDCNCTGGSEIRKEPSDATVVEVGESIILGSVALVLTFVLMISLFYNYKQYNRYDAKKNKFNRQVTELVIDHEDDLVDDLQEMDDDDDIEDVTPAAGSDKEEVKNNIDSAESPESLLEDGDSLTKPLLSGNEDEEVSSLFDDKQS